LPLVGYAPFINKHDPVHAHRGMMKLSKKYGEVVGFYLGPKQPVISVCGGAVREALRNGDFGERPVTNAIKNLFTSNGKVIGLFFARNEVFDEQHRFAARHLIDLAKPGNENVVNEVIADFLANLKDKSSFDPNRVVNFKRIFNVSIINILWATVAGRRFQLDDAKLDNLIARLEFMFRSGNMLIAAIPIPVRIVRFFPCLEKVFGISKEIWDPIRHFIQEGIDEHSKKDREKDGSLDFIHAFQKEIFKAKNDRNSSFNGNLFKISLINYFK